MAGERDGVSKAEHGAHGNSALATFLRELELRTTHLPHATPLPPPELGDLREVTDTAGLADHFAAQLKSAGGTAHFATRDSWLAVVNEILRGRAVRTAFLGVNDGSALNAERASALREALAANSTATTTNHDDETLFDVDAAITGVAAAIAETGTIVWTSGTGNARGATLIPPLHIAILSESQIVPDLFDYFEKYQAEIPEAANVNLITGPSKTADIEGILVTGVHGPGALDVVVIRE